MSSSPRSPKSPGFKSNKDETFFERLGTLGRRGKFQQYYTRESKFRIMDFGLWETLWAFFYVLRYCGWVYFRSNKVSRFIPMHFPTLREILKKINCASFHVIQIDYWCGAAGSFLVSFTVDHTILSTLFTDVFKCARGTQLSI